MKAIIEDLHGNVFEREEFHINPGQECTIVVHDNEDKILTRDLVTGLRFLLARYKKADGSYNYGYVYTIGTIHIYGPLKYLSYKPKNDIRSHGKE